MCVATTSASPGGADAGGSPRLTYRPSEAELKYPRRVVLYHGKGFKIGITVFPPSAVGGRCVVQSTPQGYPAAKSGLLVAGDVILAINGVVLTNLEDSKPAIELLSSKHGDHVEIEIAHRIDLTAYHLTMKDLLASQKRPSFGSKLGRPFSGRSLRKKGTRTGDVDSERTSASMEVESEPELSGSTDTSGRVETPSASFHEDDEDADSVTDASELST